MKNSTRDDNWRIILLLFFIFRLISYVLNAPMQIFKKNDKCTEKIYRWRKYKKIRKLLVTKILAKSIYTCLIVAYISLFVISKYSLL